MKCGCTDTTPCNQIGCGCKFKVDAGCITYSGVDLTAAGFVSGDSLSTILTTINQNFIDYGPGDYLTLTTEAPGANCTFGGLRVDLRSGQTNAIKSTQYLCGVNNSVQVSGHGTTNTLPLWTPDGQTLGDSVITQSGTTVTIGGTLKVTGGTPGAGKVLTSDATGLSSWTTFDLTPFLKKDGSVALTSDWNAGSYTITSNKLVSGTDATISGLTVGLGSGTGGANTTIGYIALSSNTTGSYNTAIGNTALVNNTTGFNNTSIGAGALSYNISANDNTAIGFNALNNSTVGASNTAIGSHSQELSSGTASYNTSIGDLSLKTVTGDFNTALGYNAGTALGDGATPNSAASYSIFIGADSRASTNSDTNQIVIGFQTTGNGSNTTTIGNTSTANWYMYGDVNLKNTTAPTTASVSQTAYLPITINGTTYKLLLAS